MTNRNAYEILHISREADSNEIKRAYRKAALAYHPDRHPASTKQAAESSFNEVAQAYTILSDVDRKRAYDRMLNLAESTLAPPPTSTALATRGRRNSFSGYPVTVQPPRISTHAGLIDPYVVFCQAWGGRSAPQVFAEQLGSSSVGRSPSRSNTTPAPRSRPSLGPPAASYSTPTHSRGPVVQLSPLRGEKTSSSWTPPRPSTPGPNGPRASVTSGALSRLNPNASGHAIPRPNSAYGATSSSRPRPTTTSSYRSIYDDAAAAERREKDGPPIIRPIAIRATRVDSLLEGGTYLTQRIDVDRTVNEDGMVRDRIRRQRMGLNIAADKDPGPSSQPQPWPTSQAGPGNSGKGTYPSTGGSRRRSSSVSGGSYW